MDENLVMEIQRQFNRERYNSQAYLALASMCENMVYDGLAAWFRKQAGEEQGHAQKFAEFLISKRIAPQYDALESVSVTENLMSLANVPESLEKKTTENLKSIYDMAEGVDAQVCALLDWFLMEQVEEETWSQDLADLVERTDATGWLIIDEKYGDMAK